MSDEKDWVDDSPTSSRDEWSDDKPGVVHSAGDTALMHGIQGASAGFLDELSGATEAAGRAVGLQGLGGKLSDIRLSENGPTLDRQKLLDAYRQAKQKKLDLLSEQSNQNPGSAMVGNVVGMFASPLNKVKGLGMAAEGAMLGGANALGYSDADLTKGEFSDAAKDTLIGAGTGYTIGRGAEKISPYAEKVLQKIASKSKDYANKFAAKALGAERGTFKSLGQKKVLDAGRQALDEGVLTPLSSTDDLISANKSVQKRGGELMDKAYSAIDDAGASTFNPLDVASKVDDSLSPTYRTPINKSEVNQLENTVESILARGEKNIPIREAQKIKEEIGAVAFPRGKRPFDPTPKQQMAMDAYEIVNKSIDDAVSSGSEAVNKAGLTDVLSRGKKLFGNTKTSEKLLENKFAREQGNKFIGLTDAITGAGALGYGGVTDDWKTAGGIVVGKKLLQKYGAQNAALVLDKVSKTLLKSPGMKTLYSKNPQMFNAMVERLSERTLSGLPKDADKNDNDFRPASPKNEDMLASNHNIDFLKERASDEEAQMRFLEGN